MDYSGFSLPSLSCWTNRAIVETMSFSLPSLKREDTMNVALPILLSLTLAAGEAGAAAAVLFLRVFAVFNLLSLSSHFRLQKSVFNSS
jgi:hypothetical protein